MKTIEEPSKTIPVDACCDVVVAGGGIGGVAAALAAARRGLSVILIEKQFGLGGLATLGHVVRYLPLCDGFGKQVMGGLAEELLHASVVELKGPLLAAGFIPVPECWKEGGNPEVREQKRLASSFNPYAFQMEMERMITEAGVTLMYDSKVCQVIKEGESITHLIVENKSGRLAIEAKVVIDTSGDADVAYLAGCPVETYRHNVLASWYYQVQEGKLRLMAFSNVYDPQHRGAPPAVGPFFSGTDHRDVTAQVLQSRQLLLAKLKEKQEKHPDEAIYPFALPSIPDFRITRRLQNRFSLGECHRHEWLEDAVGITGDWTRRGPIYPIPLRAIQSEAVPNLFVAGRCLSADHTVTNVTRAIGTCAVSGEAAGTAAALIVRERPDDLRKLPIGRLQRLIREAGGLIHPDLVVRSPKFAQQEAEKENSAGR